MGCSCLPLSMGAGDWQLTLPSGEEALGSVQVLSLPFPQGLEGSQLQLGALNGREQKHPKRLGLLGASAVP